MAAMGPTDASVADFINALEPEEKRAEAKLLDKLFRQITGFAPRLWSGGIVGYGSYDYTYASGHSGTFLASGFAPRSRGFAIYVMPGYADYSALLEKLGPHKMGKSCLNITKLEKIDTGVLGDIVAAGLKDLEKQWPVNPS